MSDETLWAVHYQGPDSICAAASHADAVDAVAYADRRDAANREKSEMYPMLSAQLIEWPFSAKEHAEDLDREPGI